MRRSLPVFYRLHVLCPIVMLCAGALFAQSSLKSYWNFDEPGGQKVVDWSDHGNTGVMYSVDRVIGKEGNALSFSGDTSSYVYIKNSSSLNFSNQLTIECRVKIRQASPVSGYGQTIVRKEKSYVIGVGAEGSVGFFVCPGYSWDGSWTLTQQKLIPGTWNHIAGTWDGQTLKVYINGILDVNTMAVGGTISTNDYDVYMGKFYESNYEEFNGSIDELKLYSVALPADSILAHYNPYFEPPVLIPVIPDTTHNRRQSLHWHAGTNRDRYRIQISTTSDFLNPFVSVPLEDSTFTPQVDLPCGVIYWRVAIETGSVQWWSIASSFVVEEAKVVLISPVTGALDVPPNLTFKWYSIHGAQSYRIQVSTTRDLRGMVKDTSGVIDTSFAIAALRNGTKYYWRVNMSDVNGTSPWSTLASFTTIISLPTAVVLVSPVDLENLAADSALLRWNKASPSVTNYFLQVAADSNMSRIFYQDSTLSDTVKIIRSLAGNRAYWWRVKAQNKAGWGRFSVKRRFIYPVNAVLPVHDDLRKISFKGNRNVLNYTLPHQCFVRLAYYDGRGRLVAMVVNQLQSPGYYSARVPMSRWAKGTYIQVFRAGAYVKKEQIVVMR